MPGLSDQVAVRRLSCCDHFLLPHRCIEEGLHWCFAEAPSSLRGPHGPVESFTDPIGLGAVRLSTRVVDVLSREIEFILVPLGMRLLEGERNNGVLDLLRQWILEPRLLAADLLQPQLAAFVVKLLETVEAVAV
jgi:hypothetical protein